MSGRAKPNLIETLDKLVQGYDRALRIDWDYRVKRAPKKANAIAAIKRFWGRYSSLTACSEDFINAGCASGTADEIAAQLKAFVTDGDIQLRHSARRALLALLNDARGQLSADATLVGSFKAKGQRRPDPRWTRRRDIA